MMLPCLSLRLAREGDFPFIRQISQDPSNSPFITDEDEDGLRAYLTLPSADLLIAEDAEGPAGYALFGEIGDPSGRVELRRLALARKDGGLGRAFVSLLINRAFETYQARRLWLDASGENPRAMALYEKLGFQREAVLRRHWYRPCLGRVVDLHIFGLLRDEWAAGPAKS